VEMELRVTFMSTEKLFITAAQQDLGNMKRAKRFLLSASDESLSEAPPRYPSPERD